MFRFVFRSKSEQIQGNGFFAHNWKLPAYSGAILLTIDKSSFFTYNWSSFTYTFSFLQLELFCLQWESASNKRLQGTVSKEHSLFSVHTLFPQVFWAFIHGFFSATGTPNSHNHSYVHYSLNSRANVITRMYIHYSRRMVLANVPPFTCLLVTTNTGVNH